MRPQADEIIDSEACSKIQSPDTHPFFSDLLAKVSAESSQNSRMLSGEALFDIKMCQERALNGDEVAAVELHKIARNAVSALNLVISEKPELLRSEAGENTTWPTLFSYSPIVQASNDGYLQAIGFATKRGRKLLNALELVKNPTGTYTKSAKRWALFLINSIQCIRIAHEYAATFADSVATASQICGCTSETSRQDFYDRELRRTIGELFNHSTRVLPRYTSKLLEDCAALPDFSSDKSVINQWWNVCYELLMLNTNGHPERMPMLYNLGRSREKHYSGLKVTMKGDYYNPKTFKANVRSKILTDLKEEFERLARQSEKSSAVKRSFK